MRKPRSAAGAGDLVFSDRVRDDDDDDEDGCSERVGGVMEEQRVYEEVRVCVGLRGEQVGEGIGVLSALPSSSCVCV